MIIVIIIVLNNHCIFIKTALYYVLYVLNIFLCSWIVSGACCRSILYI